MPHPPFTIRRSYTQLLCCLALLPACSQSPQDVEAQRLIHADSAAVVGPLLDRTEAPTLVAMPSPDPAPATRSPSTSPSTSPKQTPQPIAAKRSGDPVRTVAEPEAKRRAATADATPVAEPREAAPPVTAKIVAAPARPNPSASIRGQVRILGDGGEVVAISGSIVRLQPVMNVPLAAMHSPALHIIDMKDKTYTPRFLTVRQHDQVAFTNSDAIKHNVFSSSGKNAFDLGTFGGGKQRVVALGETGIVKVYCNIHPEMATFIAVSAHPHATVTAGDGSFAFEQLTPGHYELEVWHLRGEKTQTLHVQAGQQLQLAIDVNTALFAPELHKNKFGKAYPKASIFEDEFY